MQTVNVGQEFSPYLVSRDEEHRGGFHSGREFRNKYLSHLDNPECWRNGAPSIVLDFSDVTRLGFAWSNEAFAFFTQYADPKRVLKKIRLRNISKVKRLIIKMELEAGYRRLQEA